MFENVHNIRLVKDANNIEQVFQDRSQFSGVKYKFGCFEINEITSGG